MSNKRFRWLAATCYGALLLTTASCTDQPSTQLPTATPPGTTTLHATHTAPPTSVRSHHARAAKAHPLKPHAESTSGIVLPDRKITPGALNPRVRQNTIRTTICVSGWTEAIRPDSSYTTALKARQLDSGYNFRGDTAIGDYEEDHLISLELGGSPSSVRNLWPEPYGARAGARVKDQIENKLHDLVCAGRIKLRIAQHAIAVNWWRAYQRFGHLRLGLRPTHTYHRHRAGHRRSCTTTSSGSCIRGGEFCPQAAYGTTGRDAAGDAYMCSGDTTHPRWEPSR